MFSVWLNPDQLRPGVNKTCKQQELRQTFEGKIAFLAKIL